MSQQPRRIVRDDDVMGGEPVVRGRRIGVRRIHTLVEDRSLPPEEVAQKFDVDVEDVTAALEYYEDNPDVIDAIEARQKRLERRAEAAGMADIEDYAPGDA